MQEILAELIERGPIVLYLSMPGLQTSNQVLKPGLFSAEWLLTMPPNVPVMIGH
jgi:hypothetical protein